MDIVYSGFPKRGCELTLGKTRPARGGNRPCIDTNSIFARLSSLRTAAGFACSYPIVNRGRVFASLFFVVILIFSSIIQSHLPYTFVPAEAGNEINRPGFPLARE